MATFAAWLLSLGVATAPLSLHDSGSPVMEEATPPAVTRHARGSFTVEMKAESETRYALSKRFAGEMIGTGRATMVGDTTVNAYVALERFEGTLNGRRGGFVLLHRGWISKADGMRLDIVIAPDSGSGELVGISGSLVIEIKGKDHFYDLAYSLPAR